MFSRVHAARVALVASLILLAGLPGTAGGSSDPTRVTADGAELIVGFKDAIVGSAITLAGGTIRQADATLSIAIVSASDPARTAALLRAQSAISFVEANGPVFAEASGWDASGWDASGWDASGWDASGWDASGWDASGWDASSWDASGWDASGWDASGWDASGWDASGWDASGWDASGWDASGWDASGWDASGWDASGWDASGWDASGWDSAQLTEWGRTPTPGKDPLFPRQWGIRAASLVQAGQLAPSASSQSICIVDSGVDHTHPDLASRMWSDNKGRHGTDLVNADNDPMDDAGHGTHVAGIAAAASRNGAGIMGGSSATIMAVKVLDRFGVGTEANLALGIEWCAKNGARVISMSLGTPQHSPAIERAVKYAAGRGALMIASIGNEGKCYDCVRFPAAYEDVLAVGAVQPDGTPAPFTSVSWAVDIAAPGVAIVSTTPADSYRAANGTSQAVPFVSAAASLLFAAQPTLTASAAAGHLTGTATDLGPAGRDPYVGAGALDAEAALRRAIG